MNKYLNYIITIGALCAALADAGNLVPAKIHGWVTLGAVVCGVLAKSPVFQKDN